MGNSPSSVSRIVPPPIPVMVPRRTKPTMSISLREATSAPVVAKTTIPSQSRMVVKVSNIAKILPLEVEAPVCAAPALLREDGRGHPFHHKFRRVQSAQLHGLAREAAFIVRHGEPVRADGEPPVETCGPGRAGWPDGEGVSGRYRFRS